MLRSLLPLSALMLSACIDPFGFLRHDEEPAPVDDVDDDWQDDDGDGRIDDGACFDRWEDCIGSGADQQRCDEELEACLTDDEPSRPVDPGEEPGPDRACDRVYEICIDLDLPEDYCAGEREACLEANTPDPCDVLHEVCLDLGLDPAYCVQLARTCRAENAPADTGDTGAP